jgi:hypothetical protein
MSKITNIHKGFSSHYQHSKKKKNTFRKSPASILRWNSSFRKETRMPRPQCLFNCNPYTHFWQKCYMTKITNIHEDFFLCHQYSKQTVRLRSHLHNTNFTIWTSTQILSGRSHKKGLDWLGMQHNDKYVKSVLNFSWDTRRPVRGTMVHINMNPHKGDLRVSLGYMLLKIK